MRTGREKDLYKNKKQCKKTLSHCRAMFVKHYKRLYWPMFCLCNKKYISSSSHVLIRVIKGYG